MKYVKKLYYVLVFVVYYFNKLLQSNLYIAADILTPRMRIKPGIITVPVDMQSRLGLLMFSNLLSMTPGTLSIRFNADLKSLEVHVLYIDSKEHVLNEIQRMENKIKLITG